MIDIKQTIQEIKNKINITDVIGKYTQLRISGNKFIGKCPLHDDKNPSLIVYPNTKSWFCFGCHSGGDVFDFLVKAENSNFYTILKNLADSFRIDIGDRRNYKPIEIEEFKKQKLDKILRTLMLYFLKDPSKARTHLETERNIKSDIAKQFRIGWSNLISIESIFNYLRNSGFANDELKYYSFLNSTMFFSESIIYPVVNLKGQIYNLVSGSINGRQPKYLFLKGVKKGIYNLHKVLYSEGIIFVTEGVLDCLSLEQEGLNAVATLGSYLSDEARQEIQLLKDRDIIIAFDNDKAGRDGTFNLCEILPNAKVLKFPINEEKIDPNSYFRNHTLTDFNNLEIIDNLDFRINYILDLPTDKRLLAVKSIFPILKNKDEIEQAHYQKLFEKKFNINKQKFNSFLKGMEVIEIDDEDRRGKVIEIIEGQFDYISPALDFINDKAYVSVPLPSKIRIKERDFIEYRTYLITSNKERFELNNFNLFQRRLFTDTIDLNLPKRWSSESVNKFLQNDFKISLEEAFNKITNHLKENIDLPENTYYSFITVWLIGTYFHKLFNCYGFIFANGVKESGKTKLLSILSLIAFNGVLTSNISPSAIFRSINNEHCSLFIDELENLGKTDLQELRSVLLGSYKKGATVKRTEISGNKIKVVNYQTFSPKGMGNISGTDDIIASRSITIPMFRSINPSILNNEILFNNKVYQEIRDYLYICLMIYHTQVKNIYDKITNSDFKGRFWEIVKPILSVAKLINQTVYDEIYLFLKEIQIEKDKTSFVVDLDSKVIFAIANLLRENKDYEGKLFIDSKNILKYFRNTEDEELSYISSVQLGKIINRLGLFSDKKIKVIKGKHTLVYEFNIEQVKNMAERLRIKVYL